MPRLRGRHAGKRHIAVDTIGLLLTRGEHRRPPSQAPRRPAHLSSPAPAGGLTKITRCRRTVRDYECLAEHHETIVDRAMINTMSRRLARSQQPAPPSFQAGFKTPISAQGRECPFHPFCASDGVAQPMITEF